MDWLQENREYSLAVVTHTKFTKAAEGKILKDMAIMEGYGQQTSFVEEREYHVMNGQAFVARLCKIETEGNTKRMNLAAEDTFHEYVRMFVTMLEIPER